MRRVLGWASAAVIAVALAGCAGMGSKSTPCESCNYGYVTTGKQTERKVGCIVDGKVIDCAKNPGGCPECAKMQK